MVVWVSASSVPPHPSTALLWNGVHSGMFGFWTPKSQTSEPALLSDSAPQT